MLYELDHGFLDLGEIHGALAHDGLRHLALLRVAERLALARIGVARPRSAHELAVQRVFYGEQRGRHLLEHRAIHGLAARDDARQCLSFALNRTACLVETEHPQGIADLFQHLELWRELVDLLHAGAHEDVQRVFDGGQILFDRLRDGPHELDARPGETFTRLLELRLARQHLAQVVLLA